MNKNFKIALFTAVVVGIAAVATFGYTNTKVKNTIQASIGMIPPLNIPKQGSEIPDIEINDGITDYSGLPTEEYVYKFKKVPDESTDISDITKRLGIKGTAQKDNDRVFLKDGEKTFDYQLNSGSWHVLFSPDAQDSENVPTENECIKIATDYLKKNGLYKDYFTNIQVRVRSQGDILTKDYKVTARNISFYPAINGKHVYGVSRIMVAIGPNGNINEVFKLDKEFEPYKKLKLKDPKKAFEAVKRKKALLKISDRAKSATVKKAELGYWEDAGSIIEQPYLQPVWVFSGDALLDNGKSEKFDAIVPALE